MRSLLVLLVFVVASALGVVYTKYRSRMLFAEIQRLEQELDTYEVEWGQLQLEQNTWAEHSRIERLARTKLGMELPQRELTIYVKP
ncbi:MAG: cell division protein FtsL [Proteobacteria bacterium]|nr:cell division protein FtsL [Pseudomonadota bacterium]